MLQSFTWQQFLIAAMVFSLVWLVIVLLIFYRKELFELLSGKHGVEPLKHIWQEDFEYLPTPMGRSAETDGVSALGQDDFDRATDDDLMDKAAESDGLSIVSQSQFGFLPRETINDEPTPKDPTVIAEVLRTDLFDLMENVKPLFEEEELDKAGFIDAIIAQVRNYRRLIDSTLLETFYLMVAEQVQESVMLDFEVTAAELQEAL